MLSVSCQIRPPGYAWPAHPFSSRCTTSSPGVWLNPTCRSRISASLPMSSTTGHPPGFAWFCEFPWGSRPCPNRQCVVQFQLLSFNSKAPFSISVLRPILWKDNRFMQKRPWKILFLRRSGRPEERRLGKSSSLSKSGSQSSFEESNPLEMLCGGKETTRTERYRPLKSARPPRRPGQPGGWQTKNIPTPRKGF